MKYLTVTEIINAYNALATDAEKTAVVNYDYLQKVKTYLDQVQYVHATFTGDAVTVDGKLDEKAYRNYIALSDSVKLTAAWNGKNLYLGFKGTDINVTELKVYGETAVFEKADGADGAEYKVTLSLPHYDEEYSLTFKVGDTAYECKLVFDSITYSTKLPPATVIYGAEPSPVNTNPANGKPYGTFAGEDWKVVLDSFNSEDTRFAESTYKRMDLYYPKMAEGLAADLNRDTIVEVDVLVDYLPDGANVPKATDAPYRNML